jgi:hypothetical protein
MLSPAVLRDASTFQGSLLTRRLRGCWVPLLNFSRCLVGCLTYVWSIKYRLITKLNAQIETVLRNKFFKPN